VFSPFTVTRPECNTNLIYEISLQNDVIKHPQNGLLKNPMFDQNTQLYKVWPQDIEMHQEFSFYIRITAKKTTNIAETGLVVFSNIMHLVVGCTGSIQA